MIRFNACNRSWSGSCAIRRTSFSRLIIVASLLHGDCVKTMVARGYFFVTVNWTVLGLNLEMRVDQAAQATSQPANRWRNSLVERRRVAMRQHQVNGVCVWSLHSDIAVVHRRAIHEDQVVALAKPGHQPCHRFTRERIWHLDC